MWLIKSAIIFQIALFFTCACTCIRSSTSSISSADCTGHDARLINIDEIAYNDILEYTTSLPSLVSRSRRLVTALLTRQALLLTPLGDVVETGVYKGSTSAIIMQILMKFDKCSRRRFWAFDSFQGLPPPTPADGAYGITMKQGELSATQDEYIKNLKTWSAWDERIIRVSPGFFNETLPRSPVDKIAFLRLDGDLYQSTLDALESLYDRVVPGGYIYIDDYGSFEGCRNAVNVFRERRKIFSPLEFVHEVEKKQVSTQNTVIIFEAVWWRKTAHADSSSNSITSNSGGDTSANENAVTAAAGYFGPNKIRIGGTCGELQSQLEYIWKRAEVSMTVGGNNCLKESMNFNNDQYFSATMRDMDKKLHFGGTLGAFSETINSKIATSFLVKAALLLPEIGDIVAVGVNRGGSAAIIMEMLMKFDKCSRKFWAFDDHLLDKNLSFSSNLKTWSAWDERIIRVSPGFFNETLPRSPVDKIAFLRLDGDLYQSTLDALESLYDRVVPGGYIYIDDYGSLSSEGCRNAVNVFREKKKISESLRFIRAHSKIKYIAFNAIWWRKSSIIT